MDFRYALRALRKAPGTTAVAALALALGIGVNTSSFIWVSALVLHPLPYAGLERIMTVWETVPKLRAGRDAVAPHPSSGSAPWCSTRFPTPAWNGS